MIQGATKRQGIARLLAAQLSLLAVACLAPGLIAAAVYTGYKGAVELGDEGETLDSITPRHWRRNL